MGMIARNTEADINVIALIGERGREVRIFGARFREKGLKRSVVIVATSDQPALVRIKGAFVATSIAEYFRDQGWMYFTHGFSYSLCLSQRRSRAGYWEPLPREDTHHRYLLFCRAYWNELVIPKKDYTGFTYSVGRR